MASTLTTARLRLVPLASDCTTAPDDTAAIARATDARVPDPWALEHYDQEMLDYVRAALEKEPTTEYLPRYLVTRDEPTVVGMVGCGAPDAGGRVIVGYSVLPQYQRRGYASEALEGVIAWVRGHDGVHIIAGETYPHLIASIRTMEHCGFVFAGPGEREGVIRYELPLLRSPDRVRA